MDRYCKKGKKKRAASSSGGAKKRRRCVGSAYMYRDG